MPVKGLTGTAVLSRSFVFDLKYDERRQKAAERAADLIDTVIPQYVDGDNLLVEPLPGLVMKVFDGRQRFGATVDYSDPSNLRHCRVPALYAHPSVGTHRVDIYFDTNWLVADRIQAVKREKDGTVAIRHIRPEPDATVTLLYEVHGNKGGEVEYLATGQTTRGRGLCLVPALLEPGKYLFGVTIVSLAGEPGGGITEYELKANPAFARLMLKTQAFRASDLVGKWSWHLGKWNLLKGDCDFLDSGLTLALTESRDRVGGMDYHIHGESGGKKVDLAGYVVAEGEEVPNLKFFTKIDPKEHPLLQGFLRPSDNGSALLDVVRR